MATILNNGQPVTTEAQLNDAIVQADKQAANSGAFEIDLGGNISLSTALEAINLQSGVTLDIVGKGFTLDGRGTQRGLFVYAGAVDISNLTISNMVAQGGNGASGGGGGAGLGGGLFVGANVTGDPGNATLTNVTFLNDKAAGGAGGSGGSGAAAAVGGLAGTAAAAAAISGGGGGGGGLAATAARRGLIGVAFPAALGLAAQGARRRQRRPGWKRNRHRARPRRQLRRRRRRRHRQRIR